MIKIKFNDNDFYYNKIDNCIEYYPKDSVYSCTIISKCSAIPSIMIFEQLTKIDFHKHTTNDVITMHCSEKIFAGFDLTTEYDIIVNFAIVNHVLFIKIERIDNSDQ